MGLVDLHHLTVNAFHEARGECDKGVKAVCKVVLNRVLNRHQSIETVIYAPHQFSWTSESGTFRRKWMLNSTQYLRCRKLATLAVQEFESGYTLQGADHYHADYINPPYWTESMTRVAHIGKHIFYRS